MDEWIHSGTEITKSHSNVKGIHMVAYDNGVRWAMFLEQISAYLVIHGKKSIGVETRGRSVKN